MQLVWKANGLSSGLPNARRMRSPAATVLRSGGVTTYRYGFPAGHIREHKAAAPIGEGPPAHIGDHSLPGVDIVMRTVNAGAVRAGYKAIGHGRVLRGAFR